MTFLWILSGFPGSAKQCPSGSRRSLARVLLRQVRATQNVRRVRLRNRQPRWPLSAAAAPACKLGVLCPGNPFGFGWSTCPVEGIAALAPAAAAAFLSPAIWLGIQSAKPTDTEQPVSSNAPAPRKRLPSNFPNCGSGLCNRTWRQQHPSKYGRTTATAAVGHGGSCF